MPCKSFLALLSTHQTGSARILTVAWQTRQASSSAGSSHGARDAGSVLHLWARLAIGARAARIYTFLSLLSQWHFDVDTHVVLLLRHLEYVGNVVSSVFPLATLSSPPTFIAHFVSFNLINIASQALKKRKPASPSLHSILTLIFFFFFSSLFLLRRSQKALTRSQNG